MLRLYKTQIMSKNTKYLNLILKGSAGIVDEVLKKIAEDYELDYEELKKKYISPLQVSKRNTNKKGIKTGYSMFLSDKEVNDDLIDKYPDLDFSGLSVQKSSIWRAMSKKDKEKYSVMAKEYNKNLKKEKEDEE